MECWNALKNVASFHLVYMESTKVIGRDGCLIPQTNKLKKIPPVIAWNLSLSTKQQVLVIKCNEKLNKRKPYYNH